MSICCSVGLSLFGHVLPHVCENDVCDRPICYLLMWHRWEYTILIQSIRRSRVTRDPKSTKSGKVTGHRSLQWNPQRGRENAKLCLLNFNVYFFVSSIIYCTISIDSAVTRHKASGFGRIPSPVPCHRSSGRVHLVDLLAVKKLDHIFARVWGSSGRLAKATWPNFFQRHRSSAIWPYAKFRPRRHRSHPRPNQSKWYSITAFSCKSLW